MSKAIEFCNVSKLYRLGQVASGTFSEDLSRWWTMKIRRKDDPFLTVGETDDIGKKSHGDFIWALKDISFSMEQGEVLGMIGKNGAGKSTLLKILSKITSPTIGTVKAKGRIGSLLEVGTGFNNEMTGRENIFLNGAILGMSKAEITKKLDEIIDFSGCERFIDTPVKRYSSGMRMRLGFAVATNLDPEILVVDEVLAVGDIEFRQKALAKMKELSQVEGRTVLFVSHNLSNLSKICKTGMVLDNGKMVYLGTIGGAIEHYMKANRGQDMENDMPLGTERKGNGVLRFTGVEMTDKDGTPRTIFGVGEECVIKVRFKATDRLESCKASHISVGVDCPDNKRVAWMGTSLFTHKIEGGCSTVSFRIPRLMLVEGIYSLRLVAFVEDVCADDVKNVAQFEVVYHDFFGTGLRPSKDTSFRGNAFLDYQIAWE